MGLLLRVVRAAARYGKSVLAAGSLLLPLLDAATCPAADLAGDSGKPPASTAGLSKEQKVLAVNAGGLALISAWGIVNWDYGDRRPHARAEGWFAADTGEGGADKLGHFYINYALTHGLAALYENWGYEPDRAALSGALSSFGLMSFVELGDSFSDYGFSHEDFLMNTLGSCVGYLLYTNPALASKIDFRVEYLPKFNRLDFFTDYERVKYLAAIKLEGFDAVASEPLKYLEVHLGYYARGYSGESGRERNLYIGLGVNLSRVFEKLSYKKTAKIFNYYQVPFTDIQFRRDLNR